MRRLLSIGIVLLAGCQLTSSGRIIPSPLTYSEQEKEILAIVPEGTDRDDAVKKLTAAGIEGDFGTSRSIYYCDLWNRKGGERWHMNVALLFDKSGKLYKTQVSQAEIGKLSSKDKVAAPSDADAIPEEMPAKRTASPKVTADQLKVGREATSRR